MAILLEMQRQARQVPGEYAGTLRGQEPEIELPVTTMIKVLFTDYLRYRAQLRGFDLSAIERIVRYSEERYFDSATQSKVAVGRDGDLLVLIPYDEEPEAETMTPITVHATSRQQIAFRVRTGRLQP